MSAPELRPPLGFGFAGLHRKLREKIAALEAAPNSWAALTSRVTALETGLTNLSNAALRYNTNMSAYLESGAYTATTLNGILNEIASRLAALEE